MGQSSRLLYCLRIQRFRLAMDKIIYIDGVPCTYSRVLDAFLLLPSRQRAVYRNSLEYYCLKKGLLITSNRIFSVYEFCRSNGLPIPAGVLNVSCLKAYLSRNNIEFYDTVNSKCAAKSHHRVERVGAADGIILVEMPCSVNSYYVA